MVVSSFAIGALATPVFYLGFVDTILTIFFVNLLGIIPVAFFSTFGPRFGLRQMVLSRFYFGYYGVKLSESSLTAFPFMPYLDLPPLRDSRIPQHPRLHRLVLCQHHRRRTAPQRRQL